MTKAEFLGECRDVASLMEWDGDDDRKISVTEEEYRVIEDVCMSHPSISAWEEKAREQVAEIYVKFGMTVIYDMAERAERIRESRMELTRARDRFSREEDVLLERIAFLERNRIPFPKVEAVKYREDLPFPTEDDIPFS